MEIVSIERTDRYQARKKDATCEGSRRESRREKEIDRSRDARALRFKKDQLVLL